MKKVIFYYQKVLLNLITIFTILFSLSSCQENKESQKNIIPNTIEEQTQKLQYFEDKDSLGNVMASYYLNDDELFSKEIKLFYLNGIIKEIYNINNDTIIGYATANDTAGRLFAHKNYYNMLWDLKGDINEVIFYDTLGKQAEMKSLFIDISKCFDNGEISNIGTIKVFPINTDSVEILKLRKHDTIPLGWFKNIKNGVFNINLKLNDVRKNDILIFELWRVEYYKGVQKNVMFKFVKEVNQHSYFVPSIW